jgi:hypothetical protein
VASDAENRRGLGRAGAQGADRSGDRRQTGAGVGAGRDVDEQGRRCVAESLDGRRPLSCDHDADPELLDVLAPLSEQGA